MNVEEAEIKKAFWRGFFWGVFIIGLISMTALYIMLEVTI